MQAKDYLNMYQELQLNQNVHLPCPRCGKSMMKERMEENPISRYGDVSICPECGIQEALLDFNHTQLPLEKWFAVRFLSGTPLIDRTLSADDGKPIYQMCVSGTVEVTEKDLGDIMTMALDGGIAHWCDLIETIGERSDLSISEELAKGAVLALHDLGSKMVYSLTRAAFLKGIWLFLNDIPRSCVQNGKLDTSQIDAEDADFIVQLALFGEIVYG